LREEIFLLLNELNKPNEFFRLWQKRAFPVSTDSHINQKIQVAAFERSGREIFGDANGLARLAVGQD
jgi:hypothetical protein